MLENKVKLIIKTNGEVIKRLATKNVSEELTTYTYKEDPHTTVSLEVYKEELHVIKQGSFNYNSKHVENKAENIAVEIDLNGSKFQHNVTLITKYLVIKEDLIHLEFTRDDENIIIDYKIEE